MKDSDKLYCVECEEDLNMTRGQAEEISSLVYVCPNCDAELSVHELVRMYVN